jgi:hypothetical protein
VDLYFSDVFGVPERELERHGAFNISLVADLPLFIDPFLLFNSSKPEYRSLHDEMIAYLRFLRVKSEEGGITSGLIRAWYCFAEVKQNWLGFSEIGNRGHGLGGGFARALNANLAEVFPEFGQETITRGSHIEKLCLFASGIGRDMISDFTTNLIKGYLLRYTEALAEKHIAPGLRRRVSVARARFDYRFERWMAESYSLPFFEGDYVIVTPRDILTKDDTWISYADMVHRFSDIPNAMPDEQLRAEVSNYFASVLPPSHGPSNKEYEQAVRATLARFPMLLDYYIKLKEETGDEAKSSSAEKVFRSHRLYVEQFGRLAHLLADATPFYRVPVTTREETLQRLGFFKDVIENKGGHRWFYLDGRPIRREEDVRIMFRLVWYATPSDVSTEVNDGRGPADFKISRGSSDKTLVEFKLASNPQLKRNLRKQVEIYKKASDAATGVKAIVFFTEAQQLTVLKMLQELKLAGSSNVVLIDARKDNKPSGSKA